VVWGWLKKKLGSVPIGGQKYSFKQLQGEDPEALAALGAEATGHDQFEGAYWCFEGLLGQGDFERAWSFGEDLIGKDPDAERVTAAVEAICGAVDRPAHLRAACRGARAKGRASAQAVCALHSALARSLSAKASEAERVAVLSELAALARDLAEQGEGAALGPLLEKDAARAAGKDKAGPELSSVLLELGRVAHEQKQARATIALLDRRMAFKSKADARAAMVLLGGALGGGDRAISKLHEALKLDPEDNEAHFLLGRAHAGRAKKARSQSEFDRERKAALEHLERARAGAGSGAETAGVVAGAAGGVALLALIAPVYDEIMYMQEPKKHLAAAAASSFSSE